MVKDTRRLETSISRLLTVGTMTSLIFLSLGLIQYTTHTSQLSIVLDDSLILSGRNMFDLLDLLIKDVWNSRTNWMMATGIVSLIATQFIRVILSVIHFSIARDWKYVSITSLVLSILTLNLLGLLKL